MTASKGEVDRVQQFRIVFYIVMAGLNWMKLSHGPCNDWKKAFAYYHIMWLADVCPPTVFWSNLLQYSGFVAAISATYFDFATVVFAILQNYYVYSSITNFVNHDYLFGLMTIIFSIYCYSNTKAQKLAWLQALRGNICVVYFYAALWKLITRTWLNGTICRAIFISFEEQGVASGVPWSWLETQLPYVFEHIAWAGLFLDATLAAVLLFLPIGHRFQQIGVIFHGFTALTMAQRIGYAFPASMMASGLLFLQTADEPSPTTSHARWFYNNWRRYPFVTCWLLIQWGLPARMPFVSNGLYKYTGEGYRFSWTMMLHGRDAFAGPGLNFMSLHPICGNDVLELPPNPAMGHFDIHSFPYERRIGMRGLAALGMFPRQLPHVAQKVATMAGRACLHPNGVGIYGTLLSRVDGGPFHRLIDPQQNLLETHNALVGRSPWETMVGTLFDKAPTEYEFLLPNVGAYSRKNDAQWKQFIKQEDNDKWIYFVDRIECLAFDPIGIFGGGAQVIVVDTPVKLQVKACKDLTQTDCEQKPLKSHDTIPPMASIHILVDPDDFATYTQGQGASAESKCRLAHENVLIKVRPEQAWSPPSLQEHEDKPTTGLSREDTPDTQRLFDLLANNQLQEFRQALQENPSLAFVRSSDGRGPMWWAVQFGRGEILQLLLSLGVSHTDRDLTGLTPPDLLEQIKVQMEANTEL